MKKDEFHSVTMKLLYTAKRAVIDIETVVAFLCTHVSKSTDFDWWKLKRVLRWLHCTINAKRILGMDNSGMLHTWINAAYAVHDDMRGQEGGAISLGHRLVVDKSLKQRINGKSTTENEVICMSKILPYNLWERNFLEYQGCVKENILYQDNQSAIKKKWTKLMYK